MGPVRQRLLGAPLSVRVACAMLAVSLCLSLAVGWFWAGRPDEGREQAAMRLARESAERTSRFVARGDALRLAVAATALADLTGSRAAFLDAEGGVLVDTRPGMGGVPDEAGVATVDVLHAGKRVGELRLWTVDPARGDSFSWGVALVVLLCTLTLAGVAIALAHRLGTRLRAASHAIRDHAGGRPMRLAVARVPAAAEIAEFDHALRQLGSAAPAAGVAASVPVLELARRLVVGLERQRVLVPGHADRTARLAGLLADRLGMIEADRQELDLACRLHELGKAWLRPALLHKEGVWDEADRDSLRNHPARAAALLESVPGLQEVAAIVRSQCERHDGAGWPNGLRGDRIPLGARILAVASRFDLIRSGIHGWALGTEAALVQLRELRGSELDPWLVDLFAEAVGCVPEDFLEKVASPCVRLAAASYLVAATVGEEELGPDDTGEIELMAEGTRREGT